jgi:hypothetical protein
MGKRIQFSFPLLFPTVFLQVIYSDPQITDRSLAW